MNNGEGERDVHHSYQANNEIETALNITGHHIPLGHFRTLANSLKTFQFLLFTNNNKEDKDRSIMSLLLSR